MVIKEDHRTYWTFLIKTEENIKCFKEVKDNKQRGHLQDT